MTVDTSKDLFFDKIVGFESDPKIADKLHSLEHKGALDIIDVKFEDAQRRRMRLKSRKGKSYYLTLSRDQKLSNGSVLSLEDNSAIVVRVADGPKIRIIPHDTSSALRLGYFCGNLHWKVGFKKKFIEIVLDGEAQNYLDRLENLKDFAKFECLEVDT